MEEGKTHILTASKRILSKLQLLVVFFSDDTIYKIFLRSQVIQQLFEENDELDINHLELFHLQFTSPLIELLKSIKRANEKKVGLIEDEIRLNEELITRIKATSYSKTEYNLEIPRQSLRMKNSLRQLYSFLSTDSSDYPYSKNIHSFSARFATEYYYNITPDLLAMLTKFAASETYSNAHAIIQRKLMGLLCKYDFNIDFYCGLISGSLIIEVYVMKPVGTFFIFFPDRNLFLLCDAVELQKIKESQVDKRENIVPDLMNANDQLRSKLMLNKVFLPPQVKTVLAEHYHKIADINFMQDLTNFDKEVNILKTMLNTNII
ncbi:MAG: hypothetical protein EOP51_09820 [Sphingobacteriales bacterium]|nr:MAG: hypothetical protein EOP51_09820 [Sphingobacteriales bacterium]